MLWAVLCVCACSLFSLNPPLLWKCALFSIHTHSETISTVLDKPCFNVYLNKRVGRSFVSLLQNKPKTRSFQSHSAESLHAFGFKHIALFHRRTNHSHYCQHLNDSHCVKKTSNNATPKWLYIYYRQVV